MPYLKEGRKKELTTEPKRANSDGDFNFLYSREYLKAFVAKPSYATIALIRKASVVPHKIAGVEAIDDLLIVNGISTLDRQIARDLAFTEFYERVGKVYEHYAQMQNGDLVEYADALTAIVGKFSLTR